MLALLVIGCPQRPQRVQELRRKRGWSAAGLAEECAELGMPELNRSVIANIESGRRRYVSTDELLTLAYALDVAPIHLMVPIEVDESTDAHQYPVTPDRFLPVPAARAWIRGEFPPPGRDPRTYYAEVPRAEFTPPQPSPEQITETGQTVERHRERVDQVKPQRAGKRATTREDRNTT